MEQQSNAFTPTEDTCLRLQVQRLERQVRALRVCMAGLVGVAAVVGLTAQAVKNDTLEVTGLFIVDDQGRNRGYVGIDEAGEAVLSLRDSTGEQQALLTTSQDKGPTLYLSRENISTAMLSAKDLYLRDEATEGALAIDPRSLIVWDSTPTLRAFAGIGDVGPVVELYNTQGAVQLSLQVPASGPLVKIGTSTHGTMLEAPGLTLFKSGAVAGILKVGEWPSLVLRGNAAHVVLSAGDKVAGLNLYDNTETPTVGAGFSLTPEKTVVLGLFGRDSSEIAAAVDSSGKPRFSARNSDGERVW